MNILITGCGSGLGKTLLNQAVDKGHSVVPHFRNGSVGLIGDICEYNFPDKVSECLESNDIEVFINNAAVYIGGPLEDASEGEIDRAINVNVTSQILMLKRVYDFFKKKKSGLIININSLAGIYPSKNESIYCATKFALKGFSKSLQIEAIGTGVEIVDVYPGAIQTRMTESRNNYDSLMKVDEVADQILDLISDKKYYINELILRKRNESSNS